MSVSRRFGIGAFAGFLLVAAVGFGFGLLLLLVRGRWAPLTGFDVAIADGLNAVVSPYVGLLRWFSQLGGRPFMFWLVVLAVLVLLIRRRWRLALYLVVTGVGALLLDPSLKALVGRVRPVVETPVAHAPGNSFPSGHALGSMVVYGALVLVFLPAVPPRWRKVFVGFLGLIVLLIGFSRVALGVHYTTDVLGGWLLGVAWLGVTAYAFRPDFMDRGLEPSSAADLRPAPAHHGSAHPWRAVFQIVTGWVLTFGLVYVLGVLVRGQHDDGVNRWLQSFRTPSLDDLSYFWSKAGDTHAITLVLLISCPLALALWRQWRPVVFLLVTMAGEITLFLCTAAAVERPRPRVEQMDGQMPTSSFPSGHIAATLCLWTAIAILVIGRGRGWYRWLALVPAIVMPAGVALSRVYRGMHHPTDVLGALLLTALWLGVLCWAIRPLRTADPVETNAGSASAPAPAARESPPRERV
ncbi:phosphatase PAP2 family protein [Actinoplanes sp. NPDC089786]|uniref:phosphatase PAP2 family protein n=1 Tax=Actinoplanes sp. NPDC089786 TaxID=3155185 RepID=UPI0034424159